MNNSHPDSSNPLQPGISDLDHELKNEEIQLIAAAQKGDTRAFDKLVTLHRGKFFAMIQQMIRSEADAWDLSQDVFVKAWKALPNYEAKAKLSTWLFRIAHNTVTDWARRQRMQSVGELNEEVFSTHSISPDSVTTPHHGKSPDDSLIHSELREKIEIALSKISPEHREAILLKDVQGLSYKEIAETTQSTMGTVMSRIFYARQKLQLLLKDEYQSR